MKFPVSYKRLKDKGQRSVTEAWPPQAPISHGWRLTAKLYMWIS